MKDSNVLHLLVDQSKQVHRNNLGRLGEAQRQLEQSRSTQKMLSEYRQMQEHEKGVKQGDLLSLHHLAVRDRFIEKLDVALKQQDDQVSQNELNTANNQKLVIASATRLRSIERLLSLRQSRQSQKQQKTEQKHTDEQAALLVARRQRT